MGHSVYDAVPRTGGGSRAIVVLRKTGRPVQFELFEQARGSMLA